MKTLILTFALIASLFTTAFSQCTVDVPSSNGYTVHIEGEAISLSKPGTCGGSYTYQVVMSYNITFVGGSPGSLWTLQGSIECDDDDSFFNLPNGGGTGTVNSANVGRPVGDCATSTPSSVGCNDITYEIHGPGIPSQTVTCTALPIELIYIDAVPEDRGVMISWATATETNNDYFEIQRSEDAFNFEVIGKVDGAGNSLDIIGYNFMDTNKSSGIYYYRIKQIDYDGQFDYSPIVASYKEDTDSVNIYPTISSGYIYVETDKEIFNLEVYNTSSQSMGEFENTKIIDTSDFLPGIYFVRYFDGVNALTKKVLIK